MQNELSGSQLDKLSERLRKGPLTLADLQQLRRFLETLDPFAQDVFASVRDINAESAALGPVQITRRTLKTVRSIVAKLRRQSTTLRQIQDLVGCRVVVFDSIDQAIYKDALIKTFPEAQLVDRMASPQHGYRALHFIVRSANMRFEIQLRTRLQDEWANIVEKIADRIGLDVKYGGGPLRVREALQQISDKIKQLESQEVLRRIELAYPGTGGQPWLRLRHTGWEQTLVSRAPITPGTSVRIFRQGETKPDELRITELLGHWDYGGSMYEYEYDWEAEPALSDNYDRLLADEDLWHHELQDMLESLQNQFR